MEPYYYQTFYWNREYGLKYDITNNLRMEYSATMNALIEEPRGRIDTGTKKDSVWRSIKDLGKAQQFNQKVQFNYNVPINKLPLLDWTRLVLLIRQTILSNHLPMQQKVLVIQ
jgi:cell surface protein SprA